MSFNEQLPDWEAPGTEPPASKRKSGWAPSDKPPADYFNWLFNRIYRVLKELREKAVVKTEDGKLVADQLVDGAATDAAIGSRTADPTQVPTGLTATLGQWISHLVNRYNAITGKAWPSLPTKTIEQLNNEKASLSGAHFTGNVVISNNVALKVKDKGGTERNAVLAQPDGNLYFGSSLPFVMQSSVDPMVKINNGDPQVLLHAGNYASHINRLGAPADTRNTNILPGAYPQGITNEFKLLSAIGIKAGSQYGFLVTYKPWTDDSGGSTQQMCFAEDTTCPIWHRSGTSTGGWGIWKPVGMNKLRYSTNGTADSNGKYPTVDYTRNDGLLYARLVHSNPDVNGNYRTVVTTYYGPDGKTALGTERVDRTFDENGTMTSEA
ncbi:hypothetical protein POF51_13445 [Brevibacillus sp. AG]|uniref:hypothetical protein n=1 Tax=Brevibacillus sp. AG TaxID=3020891 RepID=UPI00233150C6|nr:hypothetical protein [Brevibacillus sp. AG]MDC0761705.1 hypothetical protein [Brevibacillus sp. AG]